MGESIPYACQDWANTKAAYRFFANSRVEEAETLSGHFSATRARFKVEIFHKVLKSGCRAEDSKLRTADRLANLMAVFCILSWRVLWLTMIARAAPDEVPDIALTPTEIGILDELVADPGNRRCKKGTLAFYITKLARLGGYLARATDPPPGIIVIWRGLTRLTDIELGAEIGAARIVGN